MFTNPMWLDEVQRIGFKKCSDKAYQLYTFADFIGLVSILTFFSIFIALVFFNAWISLYLFIATLLLMAARILIYSWSCAIVERKGFTFDYEKRLSQWTENGEIITYSFSDFNKK